MLGGLYTYYVILYVRRLILVSLRFGVFFFCFVLVRFCIKKIGLGYPVTLQQPASLSRLVIHCYYSISLDAYECTVDHFDVSASPVNVMISRRERLCNFIGYFLTQVGFYQRWLRLENPWGSNLLHVYALVHGRNSDSKGLWGFLRMFQKGQGSETYNELSTVLRQFTSQWAFSRCINNSILRITETLSYSEQTKYSCDETTRKAWRTGGFWKTVNSLVTTVSQTPPLEPGCGTFPLEPEGTLLYNLVRINLWWRNISGWLLTRSFSGSGDRAWRQNFSYSSWR